MGESGRVLMKKVILGLASAIILLCDIMATAYALNVSSLFVQRMSTSVGSSSSFPQNGSVSLAFDDNEQSQYDYAWPLMKARGMVGTFYEVSDHIGTPYMNVSELQDLQNSGNEIGSHSKTHADFVGISDSQIHNECSISKQVLQSYGLVVNNFAYPYGDTNATVDSIASQYYRSGRTAYNGPYIMQLPTSQFRLPGFPGETGDASALPRLKSMVDQVYATKGWAIIFFHSIYPTGGSDATSISTQDFASFLDYVISKGVQTLTVNQALNVSSAPDMSFSDGFESGTFSAWTGTFGAGESVQTGTVHSGTYAMKAASATWSAAGCYENLNPAQSLVDAVLYINFASLPATSGTYVGFIDSGVTCAQVYDDAGVVKWGLYDSGNSLASFGPVVSHWYRVELITSVSGTITNSQLLIDGTSAATRAAPGSSGTSAVYVGAWGNAASSSITDYVDDVAIGMGSYVDDIAVTSLVPSTVQALAGTIININVTVKNEGAMTETFNVTTYYDSNTIGTQNVTGLAPGATGTLTFNWNTNGLALGNYTIKAKASTVPNETNTANNVYIDGTVTIVKPPTASFTYYPSNPQVNQPVLFNASSSAPNGGTITSYTWNFDDGNTTSTPNPTITHVYTIPRTYNVTLTVTDSEGLSASAWNSITISASVQTKISIFTYSSCNFVGFKVEINGTLTDLKGEGIPDANIVVSYTMPGVSEWVPFISATTDLQGDYYSQWIPSATGDFTLKAEWIGNQTYAGASQNTTLGIIPYEDKYVFSVASNSTISALAFNSTSQELSFTATGPSGTTGFTRVTIAKALVADIANLKVYMDGEQLQYSIASTADSWVISFSYTHSTHHVVLALNPSTIQPHLRGDINNDGRVDVLDLSVVASAFRSRPGDPKWNSKGDLDSNGVVNIVDVSIVANEYGKHV